MQALVLLILIQSLLSTANATNAPSNSTDRQGWTAEPDCGRGTSTIIWQCFSTLGLCTYVAMHLDLPPIPLSAPLVMLRKIIWVLIYLIAPEAMSFTALMQFVYARDLVKECKVIGYNISMMQAFYIRGRGSAVRNLHQFSNSNVPLNRDGFDHEDSLWYHSPKAFPETDFTSIVVGAESVPSTKYLKEMSKADALVKLVTSAQALWTLAQIVARAFQRLSISLLEYATIAYIILAAVSYGLWWKKPYDISHRYVVEADQATQSGKHLVNLDEWDAISNGSHWAGVETEKSSDSPFMMALHNDLPDSFDLAYDSTLLVFCAILGGIHCLAWNYGFASLQEAWLWRACAIMAIILPFWFLVQAPVEKMLSPSIIDNSIIALYVLVRVYMIVECFLSFRDAPSSIYQQVDWTLGFTASLSSALSRTKQAMVVQKPAPVEGA